MDRRRELIYKDRNRTVMSREIVIVIVNNSLPVTGWTKTYRTNCHEGTVDNTSICWPDGQVFNKVIKQRYQQIWCFTTVSLLNQPSGALNTTVGIDHDLSPPLP